VAAVKTVFPEKDKPAQGAEEEEGFKDILW
jgi:hypothetical protein